MFNNSGICNKFKQRVALFHCYVLICMFVYREFKIYLYLTGKYLATQPMNR